MQNIIHTSNNSTFLNLMNLSLDSRVDWLTVEKVNEIALIAIKAAASLLTAAVISVIAFKAPGPALILGGLLSLQGFSPNLMGNNAGLDDHFIHDPRREEAYEADDARRQREDEAQAREAKLKEKNDQKRIQVSKTWHDQAGGTYVPVGERKI